MAAKGKKFSWNRLAGNMFPNLVRETKDDVNLSPQQADTLISTQLLTPYPRYLAPNAFSIAGIVGKESFSRKTYASLVKHGIILPVPDPTPIPANKWTYGSKMTVNTSNITKSFSSQHVLISIPNQRNLVGLLFFWEEECSRWKLLDDEEAEILRALEHERSIGEEENTDLQCALEAVRMKRELLPSRRAEGTANVGMGVGHVLPKYVKDL